jgi:hypothetical protein
MDDELSTINADPESVNWYADDWFSKYFSSMLSDSFKKWWISFYGIPSDYVDSYDEQYEYWVRCAFALKGWTSSVS